jgi:hypothetical protein
MVLPDTPSPPDDFKSVAKRLGCDEGNGRFEAKLKKIVKAKPKLQTKK